MNYRCINAVIKNDIETPFTKEKVRMLKLTLVPVMDICASPVTHTMFDPRYSAYIDLWESVLNEERGGKLPNEDYDFALATKALSIFTRCKYERFDFPEPMIMRYTNDGGDHHKEGDIVCYKGTKVPRQYTHVMVLTKSNYVYQYKVDKFGEPITDPETGQAQVERVLTDANGNPLEEYVSGWELESQGTSIMASMYYPFSRLAELALDTLGNGTGDEDDDE